MHLQQNPVSVFLVFDDSLKIALSKSVKSKSCSDTQPSQVDGSSHFKLLGRAFAGSLLKLAPIDVWDKAIDLHGKHTVPLGDHCHTMEGGGRERSENGEKLQFS